MSLVRSAEVALSGCNPSLDGIPSVLMYMIACFLDNPFLNLGSLNTRFKDIFSTEISVKYVFKDRFNIPELIINDVDENEKELKYILPFLKFKSPHYIYEALINEFMNGNKLDILLPNLMKYFYRHDPEEFKNHEYETFEALVKHKKFDCIFRIEPKLLKYNAGIVYDGFSSFRNIQEYFLTNPERFEQFKKRFSPSYTDILLWVKVALVTNMPDEIFKAFYYNSGDLFTFSPCIFTEFSIPIDYYPKIFERLNFNDGGNIDSATNNVIDFYRLLTLIRFGPDDPNIYQEKVLNKKFQFDEMFLICQCASLSNKMDLFFNLLPDIELFLMDHSYHLNLSHKIYNQDSIEMHKFGFDLHKYSNDSIRRKINESNFLEILNQYYRVVYIKLDANEIKIDFKISNELINSEFPEHFTINRRCFSFQELKCCPMKMIFDNAKVFEGFLVDLFSAINDFQFKINAQNLRLIIESEPIQFLIRQRNEKALIPRKPFIICSDSLSEVVDKPVPLVPLDDIVDFDLDEVGLSDLKSADQLCGLEKLLGRSVSTLLGPYCYSKYFQYRHVFKYLVESGQPLPSELPEETLALLKIDFPTINFKN